MGNFNISTLPISTSFQNLMQVREGQLYNAEGTYVTASFTGSFEGTASFASSALTASYAVSSSHEIIVEVSSSHADRADIADNAYWTGSNGIVSREGNIQITGSVNISSSRYEPGLSILDERYLTFGDDWYMVSTNVYGEVDLVLTYQKNSSTANFVISRGGAGPFKNTANFIVWDSGSFGKSGLPSAVLDVTGDANITTDLVVGGSGSFGHNVRIDNGDLTLLSGDIIMTDGTVDGVDLAAFTASVQNQFANLSSSPWTENGDGSISRNGDVRITGSIYDNEINVLILSSGSVISGSSYSAIIGGKDNAIKDYANLSIILGGSGNSITGSIDEYFNYYVPYLPYYYEDWFTGNAIITSLDSKIDHHIYSAIISSVDSTMKMAPEYIGFYNVIIGGENSHTWNVNNSVVVGGEQNIISGSEPAGVAQYCGIFGGYMNKVESSTDSVILGGQEHTINPTQGNDDNAIIAGYQNQISGSQGLRSAIIAGSENKITARFSVIVGGQAQQINSANSGDTMNGILAGFANNIDTSKYSVILGGWQSDLYSTQYSSILGGYTNSSNADYTAILGGQGLVASGSHQVAIGKFNLKGNTSDLFVIGYGTNDSNRADVFNIDSFGNVSSPATISGSVIDASSGITSGGQQGITGTFEMTGSFQIVNGLIVGVTP